MAFFINKHLNCIKRHHSRLIRPGRCKIIETIGDRHYSAKDLYLFVIYTIGVSGAIYSLMVLGYSRD